jgi:beta-glucosidase
VKTKMLALFTSVCIVGAGVVGIGQSFEQGTTQRVLGHRSVPLLTVDGLTFKDLDRNGRLDPYEDWRLSAETRAADLVKRLDVEQLAGLMLHGTLPGSGALAAIGTGNQYDLEKSRDLIMNRNISSFITRMGGDAKGLAGQNNRIQELAESSPFGIPVTISTDPRHHFQSILGASSVNPAFSQRPLILTNVRDKATALLGDFGIDSKELLEVLLGHTNPQGHLPFELPSSINGVMKQNGAEPYDSASPLFAYGYGLSY